LELVSVGLCGKTDDLIIREKEPVLEIIEWSKYRIYFYKECTDSEKAIYYLSQKKGSYCKEYPSDVQQYPNVSPILSSSLWTWKMFYIWRRVNFCVWVKA